MAKEAMSMDEMRASLEAQIEEMKAQIADISKSISEKGEELADQASDWADDAHSRTARAARALRSHAHDVSETVKENPGTVSSALVLGGVAGLLVGLLIGQSSSNTSYYRRW